MPPLPSLNNPLRSRTAPVNAPFTWPNSSDAANSGVSTAQLIARNGPEARPLSSWIARAASSLPVPVSPRRSTDASVAATRSSSAYSSRISGATVTMPWGNSVSSKCGFWTMPVIAARSIVPQPRWARTPL